ncbi:MAG: DUF2490 domain-containing protein [Bacteroidales bacterium]|nr:DUF2490 domain-containing protein [Bacteroidales bacterium]
MRIKAATLVGLFFVKITFAQTDLESWHAIDLNYNLSSKTNFFWDNELRYDNNSSELKKFQSESGIDYKLIKRVTLSGGYRYSRFYSKGFYRNEHRGIAILKYAPRIQRFTFEMQTRLEYIAETNNGYVSNDAIQWRNKITLNYRWPTQPIIFFLSFEHFTLMYPEFFSDKYRTQFGAKYQFNKKMGLSAFYGLQDAFFKKNDYTYILGWKLTYSIGKPKKKRSTDEIE